MVIGVGRKYVRTYHPACRHSLRALCGSPSKGRLGPAWPLVVGSDHGPYGRTDPHWLQAVRRHGGREEAGNEGVTGGGCIEGSFSCEP